MRGLVVSLLVLSLSGCALLRPAAPEKPEFREVSFGDLPGWENDMLAGAGTALQRSCKRMMARPPEETLRPAGTIGDWQPFCAAIEGLIPENAAAFRVAVETHLLPWQVRAGDKDEGLFTGYYEASLKGSRTRQGPYQTPIRARPLDHVVVDLGAFKDDWKGQRVTGQLIGVPGDYTLKPYPDRAGIVARDASPVDRILAWIDDPADAFFLEIQGSGRIAMDDGSVMHVGFGERNGQAYTAVGKVLVERGVMTKEQASMQSIRAWMVENPNQAQALMNENKSYIFFREISGDGPLGAEGVALTPERSLAVDKTLWSYGLPFYLDAAAPTGDSDPRLQRLMVAQDTGGAIRGIIRGDFFWGFGPQAEAAAGVMKSPGSYWVLLPTSIAPQ